jgi:hypothetical protein
VQHHIIEIITITMPLKQELQMVRPIGKEEKGEDTLTAATWEVQARHYFPFSPAAV